MLKSWLFLSIAGTMLVVPGWIAIGFFAKNFQVSGRLFFLYYALGMFIGALPLLFAVHEKILLPWQIAIAILLAGILFGATGNMLIFHALALAPNQALPIVITQAVSILVFAVSVGLYRILPKYFPITAFDLQYFLGTLLVIAGVVLIALRR